MSSTEPRQTPAVMQVELASLVYLLGGIGPKHLVAIGGLVPPLLVPEAPSPHRGSADIDLSLSVAITKGETSKYYRSLEEAISPYFEPFAAGFRWRKREGVAGAPLVVDFMGPDSEATYLEDGTLQLENPVGSGNTGVLLRPYPLAAAAIVEEDARTVELEGVPLVYHEGVDADVTRTAMTSRGCAFTPVRARRRSRGSRRGPLRRRGRGLPSRRSGRRGRASCSRRGRAPRRGPSARGPGGCRGGRR